MKMNLDRPTQRRDQGHHLDPKLRITVYIARPHLTYSTVPTHSISRLRRHPTRVPDGIAKRRLRQRLHHNQPPMIARKMTWRTHLTTDHTTAGVLLQHLLASGDLLAGILLMTPTTPMAPLHGSANGNG